MPVIAIRRHWASWPTNCPTAEHGSGGGGPGRQRRGARALLLSIYPLAQLAVNQDLLATRLLEMTPTPSAELRELWQRADEGTLTAIPEPPRREVAYDGVMRYYVLIACRGDLHQRELLQRFHAEGLDSEPKLG